MMQYAFSVCEEILTCYIYCFRRPAPKQHEKTQLTLIGPCMCQSGHRRCQKEVMTKTRASWIVVQASETQSAPAGECVPALT